MHSLFKSLNSTKTNLDYKFTFDARLPLDKQDILRETYAILITIYRDYFLDKNQKSVLNEILELNSKIF